MRIKAQQVQVYRTDLSHSVKYPAQPIRFLWHQQPQDIFASFIISSFRSASKWPANIRNRTISTAIVTALWDFQVCASVRSWKDPRFIQVGNISRVIVKFIPIPFDTCFYGIQDLSVPTDSHDCIHFRELFSDVFRIPLRKAPAAITDLQRPLLL